MAKYTTTKATTKTVKTEKTEAEKAEAREKAAVKRHGAKAYESNTFSFMR